MLMKLVKYDFKDLFKALIPLSGVTILLAIFTRLANYFADKISLLQYPAGLISGLCIMMIIGLPFIAFVVGITKYYNSMVKDEGYLTHTLPVKKSNLVLSKLFTTSVIVLLACLVSILSIFVAVNVNSEILKSIYNFINEALAYDKWIVILVIVSVLIGFISNILLIYASISLGQSHNGNKVGYSIIYGIVIYNIGQIIASILLFVPYIFNNNYINYLEQDNINIGFLNGFLLYANIISIAVTIIYYFITVRMLEKKLNLE